MQVGVGSLSADTGDGAFALAANMAGWFSFVKCGQNE